MNPTMLTVVASVAECISPTVLDPDICEAETGMGEMSTDENDSTTMLPIYAFVRFDIDGTITNKIVDAVTLKLTVTDSSKAPGPHSGEIWQVEPFSEADLSNGVPAKVGGVPIGPDKGAVTQSQVITWSLPKNLAAPNAGVHLGLFPLSSDGVNYWNRAGKSPPELIVEYH
ncbi:MAG: hypothetical protein IPM54_01225 [Polyangiaceae bacterium]|nr:hypothetical protein [Polyangiaceae bacterium]